MFKVGQKVVCVNTNNSRGLPLFHIKKGEIYTILGIRECDCGNVTFYLGFKTITGRIQCSKCDCVYHSEKSYFSSDRFRPLDETFATEVLEQIKEQIEQEELVLI